MGLSAGYGEIVITPPPGLDLTGYGFYLDRKGENVLDDLKIRVLYLLDGENKLILASFDLIGFSVEFADNLRVDIANREDIDVKNVLIACTHTHSGPAVQKLRGLGEVDSDYTKGIIEKLRTAVEMAGKDIKDVDVSYHSEIVEPIGFNRRLRKFDPIDPKLNVLIFKGDDRKIYLVNYACHPVVLGRTNSISADWAGRLISNIEKNGGKALFFQGFCGDIDPVTNMNRWGEGTEEDIEFLGYILSKRIFKAERYARHISNPVLKTCEKRIKLPLQVPSEEKLRQEADYWLDIFKDNMNARRFIEDWLEEAESNYERFKNNPYIENVPVQGISIGDVKIIGIPGEVFCEYGLKLKERSSPLFTFGYSNGLTGYIPVKDAYRDRGDYACYQAPKIFNVFSFSQEINDLLLEEATDVLEKI